MFFSISKTKWAVAFAFMSMFVLGISDNARGPLYPELIRYFNLTNSQASLSFAFASTACLVGNTLAAYIIRRMVLNRLLSVSLFFMMLGLLGLATAANFEMYLVGALVFGFSMGTMGVSQNLLIAENIQPPYQTKAISGLHAIYGLSSLAAPFLASRAPQWFLNLNSAKLTFLTQWQSAFYLTSLLALIFLVLSIGVRPDGEYVQSQKIEAFGRISWSALKKMLWFAGFFASYVGAEILVSSRLALYMRTYFNFSFEQSSNYVTYFFIALLIGRLSFALKHFSVALKVQLNLSLGLSLICFGLGLWVHPFFFVLVGLTMAPFYPISVVYISEKTGVQKRRYLTFVMGFQSVFVILMHLGVGYITDSMGLAYGFGLGIVLLIGSLICLNLHPEVVS